MKKYILLISSIIAIGLTSYLSLLPLNGNSQADISNLYSTSITPAGFTFSIWSLIYLSWIALGLYIVFKKTKISNNKLYLLIAAQFTSVLWLFPWHYNYVGVSIVVMFALLGTLWYGVVNREKNTIFQSVVDLFFGWILVATIANFHIFLVYEDLYYQPVILGVISLLLGFVINYKMIQKCHTIIPSLVFVWALVGIISNQDNVFILGTSILTGIGLIGFMIKKRMK